MEKPNKQSRRETSNKLQRRMQIGNLFNAMIKPTYSHCVMGPEPEGMERKSVGNRGLSNRTGN